MGARLEGKVALITGAGRGFGRGIAERFAAEGANLVLTYRRSGDGCEQIAEACRAGGGRAITVQADLVDPAAGDRAVELCLAEFGRVDVLVNNAGTMHVEPFAESTPDHWRADIDVNVYGTMSVTRAAVPSMIENRGGKIVNLSSQVAVAGWEVAPVYAATKGFVLVWTKSLARELGQYNINVNAIGPGGILTDMNDDVYPDEEAIRRRTQELPLRRFGSVQDVAASALFLATSDSDYMTGQMLSPNGGGVI